MKQWIRILPLLILVSSFFLKKFFPFFSYFCNTWWIFLILQILCLLRFTSVEEGTCRVVLFLKKFHSILFQWTGHDLDEDFNVHDVVASEEEKKERGISSYQPRKIFFPLRIAGGLWCYGMLPFHQIDVKFIQWWGITRRSEEGFDVEPRGGWLDYIWLRVDEYLLKMNDVETLEKLRVNLKILVILRVKNPWKFWFVAPSNPIKDILARMEAVMRDLISKTTVDEVFSLDSKKLWEIFVKEGEVFKKISEETLPAWGFALAEYGLQILEISSPAYETALGLEREEKLKAAGERERLIGPIKSLIADLLKIPEPEIGKFFHDHPEILKEFIEIGKELQVRNLALEKNAYMDIRIPGNIEAGVTSILSALRKIKSSN